MLAICQSVGLVTMEEKWHTNSLGQSVCTFIVTDVKDTATTELLSYYGEEEVDTEALQRMYEAITTTNE